MAQAEAQDRIKAELRTEFGKGAARRIRRAEKVPAVVHDHKKDPVHITLPGHRTWLALKHGGANALLELDLEGKEVLALTKQVQTSPILRVVEHVDFVVVKRGEKVVVDIPLHLEGEAGPEALVTIESETVEVEAEATHIPEYIEVSVEGVEAGTQIHASDLILPSGSTLLTDPEELVVNVSQAPTADELEAEVEEAEAEAGVERDEPEVEAAAEGEGEGETSEGESEGE